MNQPISTAVYTRAQILRATLLALVVAALLTVLVVLPAEYGRDPTGFGALTGLNRLGATAGTARTADAASDAQSAAETPVPAEGAMSGLPGTDDIVSATAEGKAPALSIWAHAHATPWQSGHFEVALKGDEELEYKTNVARGEPLLWRWKVKQGSQVYFEFHGEPRGGSWPKEYYESYEKGESAGGQGSFVAPFSGIHGWYWLNLSDKPVVIEVDLVGYYSGFGRIGGEAAP